MRRPAHLLAALGMIVAALIATGSAASAGSPHIPDAQVSASVSGSTLTVAFKEAGLGDEAQIAVSLTATAHCQNPGGNDPNAANKETFGTSATIPVQNGKAEGELSVTAVFQPHCDPPMDTVFDSAVYQDVTNGITVDLTGSL